MSKVCTDKSEFVKEHKKVYRLLRKRSDKKLRKEGEDQAEELEKRTGVDIDDSKEEKKEDKKELKKKKKIKKVEESLREGYIAGKIAGVVPKLKEIPSKLWGAIKNNKKKLMALGLLTAGVRGIGRAVNAHQGIHDAVRNARKNSINRYFVRRGGADVPLTGAAGKFDIHHTTHKTTLSNAPRPISDASMDRTSRLASKRADKLSDEAGLARLVWYGDERAIRGSHDVRKTNRALNPNNLRGEANSKD